MTSHPYRKPCGCDVLAGCNHPDPRTDAQVVADARAAKAHLAALAGPLSPTGMAALQAVSRGWHVLPVANAVTAADGSVACSCRQGPACTEAAKHPLYELVRNGQSNATTDPAVVQRWWTKFPDASVGVVLVPSGLIAFDVDVYKGDDEKLAALALQYDDLPDTVVQMSGSGEGCHMFYVAPGFPIRGQLGGVTMRGRNYVVLAPSTHKSGNRYAWVEGSSPDDLDVAELPLAWQDALRREHAMGGVGVPPEEDEPAWLRAVPLERRVADMRRHLEREPGEEKGVSRPGMAWDVMRTSARSYAVRDPEAVYRAALELYNPKCDPPYPEDKVAERVIGAYEKAHTPMWGASYLPGELRLQDSPIGKILKKAHAQGTVADADEVPPASSDEIRAAIEKACAQRRDLHLQLVMRKIRAQEPPTTNPHDDPERARDAMIAALVDVAPAGATDEALASILMTSLAPAPASEIVDRIRRLRARASARQARHKFDENDPPESDEQLRAQLIPARGDEAGPKACGTNIQMILRYSEDLRQSLAYNEITNIAEVRAPRFRGFGPNIVATAIKNWMEGDWALYASTKEIEDQLALVTRGYYAYDPVKDYLSSLVWDEVPRLDEWLIRYCNVADTPYIRKVGPRFMISAAARGLEPGCKVDTVLILKGLQGTKKSTAFKVLGGEWFTDSPVDISNKDSRIMASQRWLIELAELGALKRSDTESQKAFLSASEDFVRPPYGRTPEPFLRHCVFVGSTNDEEFLIDATGNRRYWVAHVRSLIDVDGLRRDRDQLWAEAVHRFRAGERWWFENHEQVEADEVAEEHRAENPWVALIADWVARHTTAIVGGRPAGRDHFTMADVATGALGLSIPDAQRMAKAVTQAMREAGCQKAGKKSINGQQRQYWTRPRPGAGTVPSDQAAGAGTVPGAATISG